MLIGVVATKRFMRLALAPALVVGAPLAASLGTLLYVPSGVIATLPGGSGRCPHAPLGSAQAAARCQGQKDQQRQLGFAGQVSRPPLFIAPVAALVVLLLPQTSLSENFMAAVAYPIGSIAFELRSMTSWRLCTPSFA